MGYMLREEADAILANLNPDDILARECKHACYSVNSTDFSNDRLTVKEIVHLKDGRKIPRVIGIENYKRPFWVTQKAFQNHSDKKEWEDTRKVQKYMTTQRKLNQAIVGAIGYGNPKDRLQMQARNQYLYGCDISTPALIKKAYQDKWPDAFNPNVVAIIDSETDVVYSSDNSKPILLTVTCQERIFVAVLQEWIATEPNFEAKVDEIAKKHIGELLEERKASIEIVRFGSPGAMCKAVIDKCHEWQPDIVAFWNILFDMGVIMNCLEAEGYDLATVFSDPSVPVEYRYFRFKKDNPVKVKEDGTTYNKAWYDMWHWFFTPASFVIVDSASVYRLIRLAKGKLPSYALDAILKKELKRGKLYIQNEQVEENATGLKWHFQMQQYAKAEYTVYNIFDCIGPEQLDERVKDLSTQISLLSGFSDYSIFNSNPKKTSDKLHFFCLEQMNKVVGSVSDDMTTELDKLIQSKQDWIVTLPTHTVKPNGLRVLEELPDVVSHIRMYVADADIASTYPNGQIIMNLSKETTKLEMCRVAGVTADRHRLLGVNLTAGPINAIEILTDVCKAPTPSELLKQLLLEHP